MMSRYGWTEAKKVRFERERRGEGRGRDYRPWLTVHDVSSGGRASRIRGMTTGRIHHFLSDLETRVFLDEDFAAATIDIREQFPLDREETRRIAAEVGVKHPADPRTRVDVVMTTDLVVDRMVGTVRVTQPIFVKYAKELDGLRTVAKLEIERRYWERRGLDLRVRTEHECSRPRAETISWMAAAFWLHEERFPEPGFWIRRAAAFRRSFMCSRARSFEEFDAGLRASGFGDGEPLMVLRHLLAHRVLGFHDLERPFSQCDPLTRFPVPERRLLAVAA